MQRIAVQPGQGRKAGSGGAARPERSCWLRHLCFYLAQRPGPRASLVDNLMPAEDTLLRAYAPPPATPPSQNGHDLKMMINLRQKRYWPLRLDSHHLGQGLGLQLITFCHSEDSCTSIPKFRCPHERQIVLPISDIGGNNSPIYTVNSDRSSRCTLIHKTTINKHFRIPNE